MRCIHAQYLLGVHGRMGHYSQAIGQGESKDIRQVILPLPILGPKPWKC